MCDESHLQTLPWDGLADRYNRLQHASSLLFAHWLTIGYVPALSQLKRLLGGSLSQRELLDYGCGTGSVTEIYRRFYGASIIGCDTSPEMIKIATKQHPHSEFLQIGAGNDIPFRDCSFSGIVSNWVLPALSSTKILKTYFSNCYRLLRKRGHLVILYNNPTRIGIRSYSYINGETRSYRPGEPIRVQFFDNNTTDVPCMEFSDYYWDMETIDTNLRSCGFADIRTLPKLHHTEEVEAELLYLKQKHVLNPHFDFNTYLRREPNEDNALITSAMKP